MVDSNFNLNVKSGNWYKHDKTPYEGAKIGALKAKFGLQKIIKESIDNSCNGLIFTSQSKLLM